MQPAVNTRRHSIVEEDIESAQASFDLDAPTASVALRSIGNKPILMLLNLFAQSTKRDDLIADAVLPDGSNLKLRMVSGTEHGVATMHDKRIMIFLISQLAHAKRATGKIQPQIEINTADYIKWSGVGNTGHIYHAVRETIERLQTTRVYISREGDTFGEDQWFSWVQRAKLRYKKKVINGVESRSVTSFVLEPCDWLLAAIDKDPTLVEYDHSYLSVSSPFMMRIYEIALTASHSRMFKMRLSTLMRRTGLESGAKEWKRHLKRQICNGRSIGPTPIPEFAVYGYSGQQPSRSLEWDGRSPRVRQEDQWYVFVRGEKQKNRLDVHLDSIPEWTDSDCQTQIAEVTSSLYDGEGAMQMSF